MEEEISDEAERMGVGEIIESGAHTNKPVLRIKQILKTKKQKMDTINRMDFKRDAPTAIQRKDSEEKRFVSYQSQHCGLDTKNVKRSQHILLNSFT